MILLVAVLSAAEAVLPPAANSSRNTTSRRWNSSIIKRVSENDPSVHGPTVLAGGSSHNGSKHGVVNVCVTRSIGDWDGARAMIPQPDVLTFEVQPSSHMRVIICSDGVWDMMTLEEACKITRRASTAKAAAQST